MPQPQSASAGAGQGVYITSSLTHATALRTAAQALGLQAFIDVADFSLTVIHAGARRPWHPRFVSYLGTRMAYTEEPIETTIGFAGWTPYRSKRWPAAISKSDFKQFADAQGVPTPAATRDPADIKGPFLIKASLSSFGEGMRGPYLRHEANNPEHRLADGEFYENFIVGHIAKAWCWGTTCVALELQRPTIVTGDGSSTLHELILRLRNPSGTYDWEMIRLLAAYCGIDSLDTVLPAGKPVIVEYRYGSRLGSGDQRTVNRLSEMEASGIAQQFQSAAAKLCLAIPPEIEPSQTLYSLDAIIDGEGTALFLEMNCNPVVHPDAYARMVADSCRNSV